MPKPNDPVWKVASDRPQAAVIDHKPARRPGDPEIYYVAVTRTIEVNLHRVEEPDPRRPDKQFSISVRGRWPDDEVDAAVWAAKRAKGLV